MTKVEKENNTKQPEFTLKDTLGAVNPLSRPENFKRLRDTAIEEHLQKMTQSEKDNRRNFNLEIFLEQSPKQIGPIIGVLFYQRTARAKGLIADLAKYVVRETQEEPVKYPVF